MKNEIYLNPLLKGSSIYSEKICVEKVCDGEKILLHRETFVHLVFVMSETSDFFKIAKYLSRTCGKTAQRAEQFLEALLYYQVIVDDLQAYPVEQISMWKHYKWINALIYHLKSQNIICVDDTNSLSEDKRQFPKNNLGRRDVWNKTKSLCKVALPRANKHKTGAVSVEKSLLKRDTTLSLSKANVDVSTLGSLLDLANKDLCYYRYKVLEDKNNFYDSRFIALETYVVIHKVKGLEAGVYSYDPREHQLCLLQKGSFRKKVIHLTIGQVKSGSGAFSIFITACLERYMKRYKHERAYRNLLTNVSEFAQQYIFYATVLGMNTWLTPAIVENQTAALLQIDNEKEVPIYTVAMG